MHSIVISVESMSIATTRTRSRVSSDRHERVVDPGGGAVFRDPVPPFHSRQPVGGLPPGERMDALCAGEVGDGRDVGRGQRRSLDDEVHVRVAVSASRADSRGDPIGRRRQRGLPWRPCRAPQRRDRRRA